LNRQNDAAERALTVRHNPADVAVLDDDVAAVGVASRTGCLDYCRHDWQSHRASGHNVTNALHHTIFLAGLLNTITCARAWSSVVIVSLLPPLGTVRRSCGTDLAPLV
jgi:hypothetical protein